MMNREQAIRAARALAQDLLDFIERGDDEEEVSLMAHGLAEAVLEIDEDSDAPGPGYPAPGTRV